MEEGSWCDLCFVLLALCDLRIGLGLGLTVTVCVCVCVWLCVVHICIASFIHKWVHLLTDIYPFLIFGHSKRIIYSTS